MTRAEQVTQHMAAFAHEHGLDAAGVVMNTDIFTASVAREGIVHVLSEVAAPLKSAPCHCANQGTHHEDDSSSHLASTLDSISDFLRRYIVFPADAHVPIISLWIAHTWVLDAFDFTPYLHICSPVKRCGKSTLLDCLRLFSNKPWTVVSISEAVLFRKIEKDCPTVLLDEVDAIFSGKGDDGKEALRSVLNAGFERRAVVPRCAPHTHALQEFRVFCAKAIAGIGKLPDTVADRSIPILLARRVRHQGIERFRSRLVEALSEPLMLALQEWAQNPAIIEALRSARPTIPDELGDRQADICEPLLAIADLAGGQWPSQARQALVEVCTGTEAQDDGLGVKLLAAIKDSFGEKGCDRLPTHELLEALIEREDDAPWATWWEADMKKSNTRGPSARLAKLLKPFGVIPITLRLEDAKPAKGYKSEQFEDAWQRYVS